MEQYTIFRAKGREIGLLFLFYYDLNGHLKRFEIAEGSLNTNQICWLFDVKNFPATQQYMEEVWMKHSAFIKAFEINKAAANLSFESLWNLYDNKVKKFEAQKVFSKLTKADVIKCFLSIPGYNDYLSRKRIAKAHLSTFINQRYFEDDWRKA
jgi:hypothetical protein